MQWDIPRLVEWNKYCVKFPPLHTLVSKFVGYKAPEEEKNLTTEQHAARLLASLGAIQ